MDLRGIFDALAFVSDKHKNQRRKNFESYPYINHPISVANVLVKDGNVKDLDLLIAAILHDTLEDTKTTFEELTDKFGASVSAIVQEVTDDKTLTKNERKLLQIERARNLSPQSKQLRIADKICNVCDVAMQPPVDWSFERQKDYLDWSEKVVKNCLGVNLALELEYYKTLSEAREILGQRA